MSVQCVTLKANIGTILAEILPSDNDFQLVLKNPVMVLLVPPRNPEDGAAVSFSPFLQFTEEFKTGVAIHRSDVLTVTTPITELLNQYNSIFGSGIVLASSLKS